MNIPEEISPCVTCGGGGGGGGAGSASRVPKPMEAEFKGWIRFHFPQMNRERQVSSGRWLNPPSFHITCLLLDMRGRAWGVEVGSVVVIGGRGRGAREGLG